MSETTAQFESKRKAVPEEEDGGNAFELAVQKLTQFSAHPSKRYYLELRIKVLHLPVLADVFGHDRGCFLQICRARKQIWERELATATGFNQHTTTTTEFATLIMGLQRICANQLDRPILFRLMHHGDVSTFVKDECIAECMTTLSAMQSNGAEHAHAFYPRGTFSVETKEGQLLRLRRRDMHSETDASIQTQDVFYDEDIDTPVSPFLENMMKNHKHKRLRSQSEQEKGTQTRSTHKLNVHNALRQERERFASTADTKESSAQNVHQSTPPPPLSKPEPLSSFTPMQYYTASLHKQLVDQTRELLRLVFPLERLKPLVFCASVLAGCLFSISGTMASSSSSRLKMRGAVKWIVPRLCFLDGCRSSNVVCLWISAKDRRTSAIILFELPSRTTICISRWTLL